MNAKFLQRLPDANVLKIRKQEVSAAADALKLKKFLNLGTVDHFANIDAREATLKASLDALTRDDLLLFDADAEIKK